MTSKRFRIRKPVQQYIDALVKNAYEDLSHKEIKAKWGRTSAFATVTMNKTGPIKIQCNRITREWPEPALIGLLSHELSHIIIGDIRDSERLTDIDVIERGLGVYLAVERIIADKYADHVVTRGRDRYLGYGTIREDLTSHEIKQLDKLLSDLGLISSSS
ncbi:MAG: hypothetical protein ACXAEF_08350 [Candidatus Thorarchaeota archaeon]